MLQPAGAARVPPAYNNLRAAELQALLAKRQASNAIKARELDEMELALEQMEGRVASFAVATPVLEMESTALQETFEKNQKTLSTLESSVADLRNRLRETQELLEMREAEVEETEEAVCMFENREIARRREISSTSLAIKAAEDGLRRRQRELLRLERTRDSEATAAYWSSHQASQSGRGAHKASGQQGGGQGGARQPRRKPTPGFAVLDENEEGDAAALRLRAARVAASSAAGAISAEEADFAQFHSLALSIKVRCCVGLLGAHDRIVPISTLLLLLLLHHLLLLLLLPNKPTQPSISFVPPPRFSHARAARAGGQCQPPECWRPGSMGAGAKRAAAARRVAWVPTETASRPAQAKGRGRFLAVLIRHS